MTDETIKRALRELGVQGKFGTPRGHLSTTPGAVEAAGLDTDEVQTWIEQHGRVDRHVHRMRGVGPNYGKAQITVTYYFPQDAVAT